MKLKDFIEHIESLDLEWFLEGEAINWRDDDCCPIWAMYRRLDDRHEDEEPEDVFKAGRILGLTARQISQFVSAADHEDTPHKGLRSKLLAATVNKPGIVTPIP